MFYYIFVLAIYYVKEGSKLCVLVELGFFFIIFYIEYFKNCYGNTKYKIIKAAVADRKKVIKIVKVAVADRKKVIKASWLRTHRMYIIHKLGSK